jgi:PAS domain S-box-containing protein
MAQHGREGEIRVTTGRQGWSLRNYMALAVLALVLVAVSAALYVRVQAEQDARQAASADANFAAQKAAKQLNAGFDEINALSSPLAADPSVAQLFVDPTKCGVGYAPIAPFGTGHIDVVRLDGSVVCSSSKAVIAGANRTYRGQVWLQAETPVIVAPITDPATGHQVVVISYPIPGKGAFTWFLDLASLGPKLESEFGSGVHQLEFLITSVGSHSVVVRSIDPAHWVGKSVDGTAFALASDPINRPDLNGTLRIYGHSTIRAAGWDVYVGADQASALAGADLQANRDLAVVLAGLAIVLIVIYVVYRRITEPIRELTNRVRLGPSADQRRVGGPHGASEIAALSDDFDKLMATVQRELAERQLSEEAAQVSERNYRMLFEGHPQPMWLYDVDTLEFLDVNASAVQRYGYSRDEFLAMTTKDIRPPQDVPKFLEIVGDPMPPFDKSGPWRHILKDGSTVQVLITSHAVRFGEHSARFVLAEDLTENQRLELELHQSQARSESDAELNRAKDEMVSMVSHELRTPLASIVGFTELLVTREVTPELRKDYLGVMLQEGHRLTSLINDFLDLRRLEGGQQSLRFAPADLTALIRRAVSLFSDASGAAIETRLPNTLPLVRVDSDAVFRVVANLLSNARKYSPAGGVIVVGAGVVDGMVEVYVQDQGLGIPVDALSLLFRKFYRVEAPDRNTIKGTGLGLAICKNIIEAHGGKIGASSKGLGKGALFHFTVPLVREQAEVGDVLVVEDDAGFAHLLQAELAARNLSSIWAPDAETAEQLMAKKSARAIVLDLLLPGLPGEAFLQQLRATHGTGIPVVVMTLKDLDAEELLSLQKAGVTAVLRKGAGMAETAANLIAKSLALELVAS